MTETEELTAALDAAGATNPTTAVPRPPSSAPSTRRELLDVRTGEVTPDPDNPRLDVGDVRELANSMAAVGLLQSIIARRRDSDGRLVVVAGHRRLAAAQLLRWPTVPVIVRRDMPPDAVLAAMLVENGQRAGLDPIEEARALNRLKFLSSCSDADLARRVGRSQKTVSDRLALLALPVEDQERLRAGQATLGVSVYRGRVAAGKVNPAGQDKGWHLGPQHGLHRAAEHRCDRMGHLRGRRVGGIACGECWESVIRADERQHIHDMSARLGRCVICNNSKP